MNKKGFLKTMEVFITVTIVLIFVMYVNSNSIVSNTDVRHHILNDLANDDYFRTSVFSVSNTCYSKQDNHSSILIINELMPDYLNYTFCVYEDPNFKISGLPDKKIAVDNYYFSSNEFIYSPRIARIFYWTK